MDKEREVREWLKARLVRLSISFSRSRTVEQLVEELHAVADEAQARLSSNWPEKND